MRQLNDVISRHRNGYGPGFVDTTGAMERTCSASQYTWGFVNAF